jgi:hypothetical protein
VRKPGKRLQLPRPRTKSSVDLPPAIAEKLHLAHYDRSILHEMTKEELQEHFGWETTDNLRLDRFFRNVIWQFYEQIQAGNPPDFYHKRGFIRGMWYPIKTPMSRHNFKQFKEDLSDTMGKALAKLVEARLCEYKDFQFLDDNQSSRVIGEGNPYVTLPLNCESLPTTCSPPAARFSEVPPRATV